MICNAKSIFHFFNSWNLFIVKSYQKFYIKENSEFISRILNEVMVY